MVTEQNQDNEAGGFKQFWVTWRSWLLLALFLLAVVVVLAALGLTGVIETGFGEYTPPTSDTERAKTLWDWMDLFLVPLALAIGAAFFTRVTDRRAREFERERIEEQQRIELDRSREAALQTYFDRITELIRDGLRESDPDDPWASLARARTLTVLRQLDGQRKGLLLGFLYDADLIGRKTEEEEEHKEAKLSLYGANLEGAVLDGADLRGANLLYTYLTGADLYLADLRWANLFGTVLDGAILDRADLRGAMMGTVTKDQLTQVKSLKGTTLPDGTVHE